MGRLILGIAIGLAISFFTSLLTELLVVIVIVGVAVYLWRRRWGSKNDTPSTTKTSPWS